MAFYRSIEGERGYLGLWVLNNGDVFAQIPVADRELAIRSGLAEHRETVAYKEIGTDGRVLLADRRLQTGGLDRRLGRPPTQVVIGRHDVPQPELFPELSGLDDEIRWNDLATQAAPLQEWVAQQPTSWIAKRHRELGAPVFVTGDQPLAFQIRERVYAFEAAHRRRMDIVQGAQRSVEQPSAYIVELLGPRPDRRSPEYENWADLARRLELLRLADVDAQLEGRDPPERNPTLMQELRRDLDSYRGAQTLQVADTRIEPGAVAAWIGSPSVLAALGLRRDREVTSAALESAIARSPAGPEPYSTEWAPPNSVSRLRSVSQATEQARSTGRFWRVPRLRSRNFGEPCP